MAKSNEKNTELKTDTGTLNMNNVDFSICSNEHSWKRKISNESLGINMGIASGTLYANKTTL